MEEADVVDAGSAGEMDDPVQPMTDGTASSPAQAPDKFVASYVRYGKSGKKNHRLLCFTRARASGGPVAWSSAPRRRWLFVASYDVCPQTRIPYGRCGRIQRVSLFNIHRNCLVAKMLYYTCNNNNNNVKIIILSRTKKNCEAGRLSVSWDLLWRC